MALSDFIEFLPEDLRNNILARLLLYTCACWYVQYEVITPEKSCTFDIDMPRHCTLEVAHCAALYMNKRVRTNHECLAYLAELQSSGSIHQHGPFLYVDLFLLFLSEAHYVKRIAKGINIMFSLGLIKRIEFLAWSHSFHLVHTC